MDWTIEDTQHLLRISLVIHGRGVPIFWRAYDGQVLKGRMKVYELAIMAPDPAPQRAARPQKGHFRKVAL